MLKRIVGLGVVVLGLFAAPAAAEQYPPKDHKVDVSTMAPCPAEPFTVSAQTFDPGSTVTVQLVSTGAVLGTATADEAGAASVEVTIPDSPAAGESVQRDIAVVGPADGEELTLTAAVEIRDCASGEDEPAPAAAATPPGDGDLPQTGSNSTKTMIQIGLALAAAGGVLLALARRRRTAANLRTA